MLKVLSSSLVAELVLRGVVVLYQKTEVVFSLVVQDTDAVVEAVLVAVMVLIIGMMLSGVVVPGFQSSPFFSIPFGSLWHSGTIGRTPSCFLSQPGAIRCPGGTIAHSRLFPLPRLLLSSLSSSSSSSSSSSKAIKLSLRSLFNNC